MRLIEFSAEGFNDTELNLRTILTYAFRQFFAARRGPRRHDSCVCPRECVFKLIETCTNSNGSEHFTATPGPQAYRKVPLVSGQSVFGRYSSVSV